MGSRLPLAPVDVAKLAAGAGWAGWQIVTAVAVSKAESNHDGYAVGVVGAETRTKPDGTLEPNPAYRSLDVGLFQVNSYWWPAVTPTQMLDPTANAAHAYKIWKGRYDATTGTYAARVNAAWSQWAVYSSGAYEMHLPAALDAVRSAGLI